MDLSNKNGLRWLSAILSDARDAAPDADFLVIVHELLHFNVPNHGKLWKSPMTAHLGDYQKLEQRLGAQHR
jgi:predicted metal-dependent hydrolase